MFQLFSVIGTGDDWTQARGHVHWLSRHRWEEGKKETGPQHLDRGLLDVQERPFTAGEVRDGPGGPEVNNPCSCAGHTGSIPSRGTKIPDAAGRQPSPIHLHPPIPPQLSTHGSFCSPPSLLSSSRTHMTIWRGISI